MIKMLLNCKLQVSAARRVTSSRYSPVYNTWPQPSGEVGQMPVTLWRKRKRTGSPKSTAMQLTWQLCFGIFLSRFPLLLRASSEQSHCRSLASPYSTAPIKRGEMLCMNAMRTMVPIDFSKYALSRAWCRALLRRRACRTSYGPGRHPPIALEYPPYYTP